MLRYLAWTVCCVLLAGLPLIWFLIALRVAERADGPSPDLTSGPLTYLLCLVIVAAVWILIAWLIRRRSAAEVVGLCAMVSASGVITFGLAFVLAFDWLARHARSPQWEPNIVADHTAFVKARAHAYGRNAGDVTPGDYVERRSWRLDEYGLRPHDSALRTIVRVRAWEEYGFPWRCFPFKVPFRLAAP